MGSVAYFPERYGDQLIPLALTLIRGKTVPPATFVKHVLVTPQNVDRIYPHDRQMEAKSDLAAERSVGVQSKKGG